MSVQSSKTQVIFALLSLPFSWISTEITLQKKKIQAVVNNLSNEVPIYQQVIQKNYKTSIFLAHLSIRFRIGVKQLPSVHCQPLIIPSESLFPNVRKSSRCPFTSSKQIVQAILFEISYSNITISLDRTGQVGDPYLSSLVFYRFLTAAVLLFSRYYSFLCLFKSFLLNLIFCK